MRHFRFTAYLTRVVFGCLPFAIFAGCADDDLKQRQLHVVSTERIIDAEASLVWDKLRWENGNFFLSAGFFDRIEFEKEGAARGEAPSTRTLYLAGGPPIRETMVAVNHGEMSVSYVLDTPRNYGVASYHGRYAVEPLSDGGSRVVISAEYAPAAMSPAEFETMWKGNQALVLDYLEQHISGVTEESAPTSN